MAVTKYTAAIGLDPTQAALYSNRSAAYAGLGDWENAAADGKKCIEVDASFLKGYHRAGSALRSLGRLEEAKKIAEKGLVHHPGNEDLKKLVDELTPMIEAEKAARLRGASAAERLKEEGNDLFKAAKFELAIKKFTDALGACTDRTSKLALTILNNRAACYQQLSDFSNVVMDTSEVIELEPDNIKALLRRALALEGLERYKSALSDIREILKYDPSNTIANAAQHRIGEAVRRLKKEGM